MNRTLAATFVAAATTLVLAPAASADAGDLPAAPSGATTSAVAVAEQAAQGDLGKAFTENVAKHAPATLAKGRTKRNAGPVNVYMLSPQFVKNGTGPVGQFAYTATSYDVNGAKATVYSAPTQGGWQGVNIATGDTEQTLATKGATGALLYEPQVHAYYAVKGKTLHALNDSATKAIGGPSISLASYATQVHAKYASMLPGSAYDTSGKAGGFAQGPVGPKASDDTNVVAASTTGGALALGGAAIVYRRRKKA